MSVIKDVAVFCVAMPTGESNWCTGIAFETRPSHSSCGETYRPPVNSVDYMAPRQSAIHLITDPANPGSAFKAAPGDVTATLNSTTLSL